MTKKNHHNLEKIYLEVPIIKFHPNVDSTFVYTWTKYKLDWRSLTLDRTSLTSLVDNHWPTAGRRVNSSFL